MPCVVLLLPSLVLQAAASMAIIVLRGSWSWGPETLLAPPQALEHVPVRRREGC
jgi:hypothetical protein